MSYQGRMKRRGHATHNVNCVCVKKLMSQQDMLYLVIDTVHSVDVKRR